MWLACGFLLVARSVAGGLPWGVVLFEGTGLVVAEGDVEGGRGVGEVLLFCIDTNLVQPCKPAVYCILANCQAHIDEAPR
jgi:hypothetical protein